MSQQQALTARYAGALMNTFGTPRQVWVSGSGWELTDADGRRYIDLLGGLAVNALGHAHAEFAAAVAEQLMTLGQVSNFFASPRQIELAERLAGLVTVNAPDQQASVFFTNSGTEANETALKLTRLRGRTKVIAMAGSFHGRTMGALSVTHNPKYRLPYEPLIPEVVFVPFGDAAALAEAMGDDVAAVVLEPIQGENGVVEAPPGFIEAARDLTSAHGALLWIDEVQTGIGRCGEWLAHTPTGVTADIVTLAKGLGNGYPIGACIAVGEAAKLFEPGSHGSTFGGNPVAAVAGLTVLNILERDGLLARSRQLGDELAEQVMALNHPKIVNVRGRGLLRGIVLRDPVAPEVEALAQAEGWIVNAPRPTVIRLAPPLTIDGSVLAEFVTQLPGWLDSL